MHRITRHLANRKVLVGALAVAAGLLAPSHGFAATTVCRTDPTVTLSNGQTITLWAQAGTGISNVTNVNYVLHIARGLSVASVTYDQYASLESFSWVADQNANSYETDTTVITAPSMGPVAVTAWASQSSGNNTYSVSGTSGQLLTIDWKS